MVRHLKVIAGWLFATWLVFAITLALASNALEGPDTEQQLHTTYLITGERNAGVAYVTLQKYLTCADGWQSPSIGKQGACSWHGGVVTRTRDVPGVLQATCTAHAEGASASEAHAAFSAIADDPDAWHCTGNLPRSSEVRNITLSEPMAVSEPVAIGEWVTVELPPDEAAMDQAVTIAAGAAGAFVALGAGLLVRNARRRPSQPDTSPGVTPPQTWRRDA